MNKTIYGVVSFAVFFVIFNAILYVIDKNSIVLNLFSNPLEGGFAFFYLPSIAAAVSLQKNLAVGVSTMFIILVIFTIILGLFFTRWGSEYGGLNLIIMPVMGFLYGISGAIIGEGCRYVYHKINKENQI